MRHYKLLKMYKTQLSKLPQQFTHYESEKVGISIGILIKLRMCGIIQKLRKSDFGYIYTLTDYSRKNIGTNI